MNTQEVRLNFVDVGASQGLNQPWKSRRDQLDITLIEPSPRQAQWLRENYPDGRVIETALFNSDGPQTLHIARVGGCSSLLKPNDAVLRGYKVAPCFEIVRTEQVRCVRYDTLFQNGEAPAPDAIKVDVQGVELQVLEGFGALLDSCLAIVLEAHFYPIYIGQRLFHDLVEFLAARGYYLRAITPHRTFDAELVEIDAIFVRRSQSLDETSAAKLSTLEEMLRVPEHPQGEQMLERLRQRQGSKK